MVDKIAADAAHVGRTLAICHCNCLERAFQVKAMVEAKCKFAHIVITEAGGITSVYAYDGGIVIAYWQNSLFASIMRGWVNHPLIIYYQEELVCLWAVSRRGACWQNTIRNPFICATPLQWNTLWGGTPRSWVMGTRPGSGLWWGCSTTWTLRCGLRNTAPSPRS